MSPKRYTTAAGMYNQNLVYARDKHLPPEQRPQPTSAWPAENVALLEQYLQWRLAGGASEPSTRTVYFPMAGHVLGLTRVPWPEMDLEAAFARALAYVAAKGVSSHWLKACHNALQEFARFLRQVQGQPEPPARKPYLVQHSLAGLPAWLVRELKNLQLLRQHNWRPARLEENRRRFWSGHLRTWRFFVETCGVWAFADLRRQHVFAYMDHRLAQGKAVSGVNGDVRELIALLYFLQEQGYPVPQAILRIRNLHQPQRLPKFLKDEQVAKLRDAFEARVREADTPAKAREAQLDRAAFYLLWQGGLRISELEELCFEDLDIPARRLTVRNSKGLKDRAVYLAESVVRTLLEYLDVRGPANSEHVFTYRNRALRKDLVRARIKAAGKRVGVKVYPHRLRHTCATQLLNAGCKVTSIQMFLGHKRLNSTMIYARVHDATVAEDYFRAMEKIESSGKSKKE